MDRRLSAIMAADVVGYSRLIRDDEERTLLALRSLRKELIDPKIEEHCGRIVKLMGDGLLVEFASVVDAVACGTQIQAAMAERNIDTPDARQIVFRVGVNLGDVVIDGDDIQGDGVNLAARLEALSHPGGMCISDAVHEQVRDRLDLKFEDFGKQSVKNIDRPVQIWKWPASFGGEASELGGERALPLPDKPSIAVLPFENMSGDAEQEYFADGIAEDVTTALARSRELFVIARNSSFSYRGKATDIRQVGRELGVRYVVEGSVRRAGERVRISAQLIEAETGNHIWADRYDFPTLDIFQVQDEITVNICGAVGSRVHETETERARGRQPGDLQAWEILLKANWLMNRVTPEGIVEARTLCEQVIEQFGESSDAYAGIAHGFAWELPYGWGQRPPLETIELAVQAGKKAIELDPRNETAHSVLCMVYWLGGSHDVAVREGEAAVGLNSNSMYAQMMLACALGYSGVENHEKAIAHAQAALQLAPRDLNTHYPHAHLAMFAFMDGRYQDAVEHGQESLNYNPTFGLALRVVAAALALDGKLEEAKAIWIEMGRHVTLDMESYLASVYRSFKRTEDAERYIEGMRLAGAELAH